MNAIRDRITDHMPPLEIENRWNVGHRHCRIGKVTPKRPNIQPMTLKDWQQWPGINPLKGQAGRMPKCGCQIGHSCGNVACPHAVIWTC